MYIIESSAFNLIISFDKKIFDVLLAKGYKAMNTAEKNNLIAIIAHEKELAYNEITEDYILDYHKNLKLSKLSEECESNILKGFTSSNGHVYRTNRDDQINMIVQRDILNYNPEIETVMWKTEDEGYIEHTREEWFQIYNEAFEHKQNQLFKYEQLKQQVINAKTDDEILAIKWQM